jgi:hypothetical protein
METTYTCRVVTVSLSNNSLSVDAGIDVSARQVSVIVRWGREFKTIRTWYGRDQCFRSLRFNEPGSGEMFRRLAFNLQKNRRTSSAGRDNRVFVLLSSHGFWCLNGDKRVFEDLVSWLFFWWSIGKIASRTQSLGQTETRA